MSKQSGQNRSKEKNLSKSELIKKLYHSKYSKEEKEKIFISDNGRKCQTCHKLKINTKLSPNDDNDDNRSDGNRNHGNNDNNDDNESERNRGNAHRNNGHDCHYSHNGNDGDGGNGHGNNPNNNGNNYVTQEVFNNTINRIDARMEEMNRNIQEIRMLLNQNNQVHN